MFAPALLPTLRARLILYGGLFLAVVLLVVGSVAFFQSKAALRELQSRNLDSVVVRLAADIDDRIRTRHVLLEQAAAGLQLDSAQFEQEGAALISRFRYLKGMFNSVLLYDRQGNVIADYPALPGRIGANVADRDYFLSTRQLLRPQVSEPLRVRGGLNRTVVVFTAPIFSPEGVFVGVLGGSLELYSPEFFGELKNISIGQSGFITINTVRSRLTIMHSDPSYIMQPSPGPEVNPALHRAFAGWQGQTEARGSDGGQVLQAYRRLQNVPWVVGATLPLHEAMQPAQQIGQQFLILLCSAIALAVPLAFIGLHRLLLPLRTLQRQLALLQAGQASVTPALGCRELQTMAADVTQVFRQRRAIEDQLAERELFFHSLTDISPMGVLVVDQEGRLQYLNPASIRVAGLPVSEIAQWEGRSWLDGIHADSLPQVSAQWQQLLASGGSFDVLCRIKHQAGVRVMVELRFVEIGESAGQRRFLGLFSDVSAREEARSGLRAERARALLVQSSVKDAVVLTNQLDEVEYVNQPAVALFGLPASDMLGRLLTVFMRLASPDNSTPVSLRQIERDHAGKPVELELLSRDMRVQPVVLTLSVISGEGPMQGYKVVVLHDDSERRQREQQHRWEANHDALTGLINRRGFLASVTSLLNDEQARRQPAMLAMMDLDHFRKVNEITGQQGGDLLLQEISSVMQRHVRNSDVLARLGGDEFAVLLYNCRRETAERIMQEMLQDIDSHSMYLVDREFRVTASIGLTEIRADDSRVQLIMERADERCQCAKQSGRNCLVSQPK